MIQQRSRKLVAILICMVASGFGCHDRSGDDGGDAITLVFAAYTTPREAYGKAIIPAFQQYWQQRTGQRVEFRQSYQGSGAQSRAVSGGFEADIVALSLAADVDRIAEAGLITHDWRQQPHGGMATSSIVVLAVRPGNPKQIHDWDDLTRDGLDILTPDPRTSGGAMWNISAMFGAALRGFTSHPPKDREAAEQLLTAIFRNVSIMDKGARESITNFERGIGDVAVTYENEVLVARQAGQVYEYVVPRSTVLIENPVALVDSNVDRHGVRPVAEAFVQYLWSAESQQAFARYGLRPLDPATAVPPAAAFPPVEDLWRIEFLGGWPVVTRDIFGPGGVYERLYQRLHGSGS